MKRQRSAEKILGFDNSKLVAILLEARNIRIPVFRTEI